MNRKALIAMAILGLCTSLLGGFVATWLLSSRVAHAQPPPGIVSAGGFQLVDSNGAPRAALEVADDGTVRLRVAGADTAAAAVLGVRPDGVPFVRITDSKGLSRAEMTLDANGRPKVSVKDEGQADRGALYFDDFLGTAHVGVLDGAGRFQAGATTDRNGQPMVVVSDGSSNRAALSLFSGGASGLWVTDQQGNVRGMLTETNDGTGVLAFFDRFGHVLELYPKGSALIGPYR